MSDPVATRAPQSGVRHDARGVPLPPHPDWDGRTTYYGRAQVKPAPFNNWVVGAYIFLAGLGGGAQLLASAADLVGPPAAKGAVRRGRYLAAIAPLLGAPLLIWDLHTPKRFYNMFRIFKRTSPMSIGTYILSVFSVLSGLTAAAQWLADRLPRGNWLRGVARVGQVPAALSGAGLGTYTAALLSATSTPLWAAAPRSLAVRFGSSSVAAGAAALSLGERDGGTGRTLDAIAVAALGTELAATLAAHERYAKTGVTAAFDSPAGLAEKVMATGIGVLLPLGLHTASLVLFRRRSRVLSRAASWAVLAGGLALRVSVMATGDQSARRPEISMRFAQPDNLPAA